MFSSVQYRTWDVTDEAMVEQLTYKPVEETEEECPESEASFPVMLLFNSDYTQEEKDNNLTGCAEICTHGRSINYSTRRNKTFNKLQHTAKQDFQ